MLKQVMKMFHSPITTNAKPSTMTPSALGRAKFQIPSATSSRPIMIKTRFTIFWPSAFAPTNTASPPKKSPAVPAARAIMRARRYSATF